jgi:hypothetical protein
VFSKKIPVSNKVRRRLLMAERRKAWLYEVPLVEVHGLRHAINMTVEEIAVTVQRFNVPVAAGVMKLWLLELNPPIMGWEGWEDAKAIYPSGKLLHARTWRSRLNKLISSRRRSGEGYDFCCDGRFGQIAGLAVVCA